MTIIMPTKTDYDHIWQWRRWHLQWNHGEDDDDKTFDDENEAAFKLNCNN